MAPLPSDHRELAIASTKGSIVKRLARKTHGIRALSAGLFTLVLLLSACGANGAGGGGKSIKLTLGAGHPPGITYVDWSQEFFVPELKERLSDIGYDLEVNEAYGGAIATHGEIVDAVDSGLLDMGLVSYPFEPSKLFLLNMSYHVPFGSPDPSVVVAAGRAAVDANPEITDSLENDYNQRLLGLASAGNYGLCTTFPLASVDDLDGKSITAAGPNLPWLKPVGASPVQGALPEWYTMLQTGVVDGCIMFPESVAGFALHEVAKNYTITNFGAVLVGGIHVNLDVWNSWPEEVQDAVSEVAREYEDTIGQATTEQGEAAFKMMEDEGATIQELSPEDVAAWADALPNIPQEQAEVAEQDGLPGKKLIQDYIDAMSEAGFAFPRAWGVE